MIMPPGPRLVKLPSMALCRKGRIDQVPRLAERGDRIARGRGAAELDGQRAIEQGVVRHVLRGEWAVALVIAAVIRAGAHEPDAARGVEVDARASHLEPAIEVRDAGGAARELTMAMPLRSTMLGPSSLGMPALVVMFSPPTIRAVLSSAAFRRSWSR